MSKRKPGKPAFSEKMLSGKRSLAELGITEADAQVPEGWKRIERKKADCDSDQELQRLFAPDRVKAALRQALRRVAQRGR